MLGAPTPITTVLGAAPPADAETARLVSFVRAAASVGLHLLLIEPGGKKPVDVRSGPKRRADDKAAQDAARAAGRRDWDRVKSKAGVFLATDDPVLLARYVTAYRKRYGEETPVNFGIAVGPSKLVVVDCDTVEQVHAFLHDVAEETDSEFTLLPPTVRSPGQRDETGEWAHRDGGHFYFTVEHALPDITGSYTAPGGYAVLWADRYVLIPPSVRPEGAYLLAGQDYPAPDWLRERIDRVTTARVIRGNAEFDSGLSTAVDDWALSVEWDDILAPAGWVLTARQDNCGCDVWTAPGDHASPKSATAHDTGCTLGRYTTENAPLHIWTDNPGPELEAWIAARGGSKTLSRLQAVAALEFGGDVGETMRAVGVTPDRTEALGFGSAQDREIGTSVRNLDEPLPDRPQVAEEVDPPDPFGIAGRLPDEQEDVPQGEQDEEPRITGVPLIMPFSHWRDYPPPQFVIDGILEHGGLSAVIGAPGVGKSGVVLDMAARIATGKRWMGRAVMEMPTVYLPGEGLAGAVMRLREWEEANDTDLSDRLFIGDSIIQIAASVDAWAAVVDRMLEIRAGLLIIDTLNRAAVGLEENSATDIGRAIARFGQIKSATGAGVMVVHHTRKDGASGRGSSALLGALDTELLVREGTWWDTDEGDPPGRPLEMIVTKQKNAAMPDHPLPMLSVPHGESFVMTGPSGLADDPLDAVALPVRAVIPEAVVSVAIRLQEFAARFPEQGLTRQEFAYGVGMDDWCAQRRDAKTAWRMKVNEAIDLGLRYGLLQTLTGSVSGARYIPDVVTPEVARQRWAAESMSG